MYVSVRLLSYAALRGFYRVIREGRELPEGPLVVVANHTNGLLDAGLLFDLTPRRVRFLAKYTLFKMPVLSWIVRAAAAIPVYRKKDNKPTEWNAQAFEEVHRALAEGEIIGVFPEGSSHSESRLQRLKTGAVRLALGAEAQHGFSLGVRLLPVGFLYEDRHALRSRVVVRVGKPVPVADLAAEFAADEWGTVERLNARLAEALRGEMLDVTEAHDRARVLRAEELLPADGRTRGERLVALAGLARRLRSARPALARRLGHRIDASLAAARARGERSGGPHRPVSAGRWLAACAVAWPARLVFGPGWLVARLIGRAPGLPRDKEPTATALAAAVLLPATVFGLTFLSWQRFGAPGAGVLPLFVALLCATPRAEGVLRDARSGRAGQASEAERRLGAQLARCCRLVGARE